jgi:hypothetical protein
MQLHYGVDFVDENLGWAASYACISHTTDGGDTWITQLSGISEYATDVDFADASNGWVVGATNNSTYGWIRRTTDGGLHWLMELEGVSNVQRLRRVRFVDAHHGWAVGAGGTIVCYHEPEPSVHVVTPNGGETWTEGEQRDVTWTSVNIGDWVSVEWNRNFPSGAWDMIDDQTENTGSLLWDVIGPATATARLRVTSLAHPEISDVSDTNFTIIVPVPPPVPDSVVVLADSLPHIMLYWAPIDSPLGLTYKVYMDTIIGGTFDSLLGATTDTVFVDSNAALLPDRHRFYVVRSGTTP